LLKKALKTLVGFGVPKLFHEVNGFRGKGLTIAGGGAEGLADPGKGGKGFFPLSQVAKMVGKSGKRGSETGPIGWAKGKIGSIRNA
jgi:hypothetical protein